MNRLELISYCNPVWAVTIQQFIELYPEFMPYVYLAPMNPIEPLPYKNVNGLFQAIMFYVCSAGVRASYACRQWELIYNALNVDTWEIILQNCTNLQTNTLIQPKKRNIYYNICKYMDENGLQYNNLNIHDLKLLQQNIHGIGDGCIAWCKKYFTVDDDCVEYTDINFKKGFEKIYQTTSVAMRRQKATEWTSRNFGRIANLMTIQIGGYS
jgi:hypothetical protein